MFDTDLKNAQVQEKLLAQMLLDTGKYDGYELCDNSDYDIKMTNSTPDGNKTTTFELKHDKYENENVAVEVFCTNRLKPTGLLATKADYFVFLKENTYYFTKPEILKKHLRNFVLGGDGNAAVMALLTLQELEKISWKKEL